MKNLQFRFQEKNFLCETLICTDIVVGLEESAIQSISRSVLIQPTAVPELSSVSSVCTGLRVGAAVTISGLEAALKSEIQRQPGKYYAKAMFLRPDRLQNQNLRENLQYVICNI